MVAAVFESVLAVSDRLEHRAVFLKIVKECLSLTDNGKSDNYVSLIDQFHHEVFGHDPAIVDRSLHAAWEFCAYYFDAIEHKFEDLGPGSGISVREARIKVDQIFEVLSTEEGEITDSVILEFPS